MQNVQSEPAAGLRLPFSVVDSHMHAWNADRSTYSLKDGQEAEALHPASHSVEHLFEEGARHGIDRLVLVQHINHFRFDNSYMLDMRRKYPDRIGVIAAIGDMPRNAGAKMRSLKAAGARGFRVRGLDTRAWLDSPDVDEMWRVAAQEGLAICALVRLQDTGMDMTAFDHLDVLCRRHPETTLVIDNIGHVQPGDDASLEGLLLLARHNRVHVKIDRFRSFSPDPARRTRSPYTDFVPLIDRIAERFGVERLMWGSDRPVLYTEPGNTLLDSFLFVSNELGLSAHDREHLLARTAERLFIV